MDNTMNEFEVGSDHDDSSLAKKPKSGAWKARTAGMETDIQDEPKERADVAAFLSTRSDAAFNRLAHSLFARLIRYFSIRGLAAETAEELAQDVLMIVYRKAEMLRNTEYFYGWFYKIARNQHLQYIRQQKRDAELVDLDRLPPPCELRPATESSKGGEFLDWISALEPDEQQIMILRYVEDLTYEEIATALAIPMGTVKWKIFHAKIKLTYVLRQMREGSL